MTMTISDRVAAMRAGQPPKPDGVPPNPFEAEQAALAAAGGPKGVMAIGSTLADVELLDATWSFDNAVGRARRGSFRADLLPRCLVSVLQHRAPHLPGGTSSATRSAQRVAHCDQPAEAGWIAVDD